MNNIRKPAVAGMFYPADKESVRAMLKQFFNSAEVKIDYSKICGIIAPHAGYIYSGQTAAYAYKSVLNKEFKNVVVISPSHREYFAGNSIFEGDYYSTPLGSIKINKELAEAIIENSRTVFSGMAGHRGEHAIEVQLPFLQYAIGNFELVPIVMGDQREEFIEDLSLVLRKVVDNDTLIVASSDLSHYYPKEVARRLDQVVINDINNNNSNALKEHLKKNACEACGGGPMVVALNALATRGCQKSTVVNYSDSGDISGDNNQVVGYMSAIIYS